MLAGCVAVTLLAVWTTLPDAAKERILGIQREPAKKTPIDPRSPASVIPTADDHQRPAITETPVVRDASGAEVIKGWLGDRHHPSADADLISAALDNDGATVKLLLHLGPELAADLAKVQSEGSRTYGLALVDSEGPILMDLALNVTDGSEFFFGIQSPNTGILRGTFRVLGCAQTGTGWFSCEFQAVPVSVNY